MCIRDRTRPVPRPFLVIATQNPVDLAGTQPLPQAQTDRFMISLSLGYPDFENELQMVMETSAGSRAGQLSPCLLYTSYLIGRLGGKTVLGWYFRKFPTQEPLIREKMEMLRKKGCIGVFISRCV